MDMVQFHERAWGLETYSGRPELSEILMSPVVAFWYKTEKGADGKTDNRFKIVLYENLDAIQDHLAKLILRSGVQTPQERLGRIFAKGKEVRVRGVTVHFEVLEK